MSAAEPLPPRVEIAIAVVERDGQFLIGLRPEGESLAGYWEFPGGKVTAGETAEDAARRECLEETGLEVRIVGTYPAIAYDYPHASVQLHFFACDRRSNRSRCRRGSAGSRGTNSAGTHFRPRTRSCCGCCWQAGPSSRWVPAKSRRGL